MATDSFTPAIDDENVSRTLFGDNSRSHSNTNKPRPLSTITNDESFKFPKSVSEAQDRIAKLHKKSALLSQENYPRQPPTRNHVQAMKRQVREKISTPSKAPRSTVNIPLNKVNELKMRLEESKRQEIKKLESAQMNAKKRAEIKERVNTVQGLLRGLNDNIEQKAASKTTPSKDLHLPRDRVSEMKSWLKQFEKENKAHADKWNTRPANEGQLYVPRSGARHQSLPFASSSPGSKTAKDRTSELEQIEGRRVSDLTNWLVDFGENNKAHFEKSTARPFPVQSKFASRIQNSNVDDGSECFPETEPVQDAQNSLNDGDSEYMLDTDAVENISMVKEADNSPEDVNISMMPAAPDAPSTHKETDNDEAWENEYQDLMMTVDIVQVESGDTWDKESVLSPKDLVDTENDPEFEESNEDLFSSNEKSLDFKEDSDDVEHLLDLVENDDESLIEQLEGDEDFDDVDEVLSADSEDLSVNSEVEQNILTFECDDSVSRMSFEGQPVEIVTTYNNAAEVKKNQFDDTVSTKSALFGENIMNKTAEPIVSNSFLGHGLSDSMFVQPEKSRAVVVEKKKTGIKKLLSSLNCMKNNKASRAAETFANSGEEANAAAAFRQKSSKSLFLSPDSHENLSQVQNSYLPNAYNNANTLGNSDGNFARRMLVAEKANGSPGSLASAYDRQFSPGSSCISGFTDVETHVMRETHDIGQHVKHLQGLYDRHVQSPPAGKSSKLYMF